MVDDAEDDSSSSSDEEEEVLIDMSRRLQYGSKRKKHARVQVKLPAWSSRGVGKTHSGYPRGIKMRVVTWRASSAASSGPCAPDLQDAFKLKKHHGRAEAFLITAYGHASLGDPQGRLRERDALSTCLARLARRKKKGDESEPEPATPLATTAPPEAPVTPAAWTGPLGTPDHPITIDIDIAQ